MHGEYTCEACGLTKNIDHYMCYQCKDFMLCSECVVCDNSHELQIA